MEIIQDQGLSACELHVVPAILRQGGIWKSQVPTTSHRSALGHEKQVCSVISFLFCKLSSPTSSADHVCTETAPSRGPMALDGACLQTPWRAEVSPLLIYRCEGLQHAFAYVSRSLAWCMNVLVEWCHLWCLKATGHNAVQQLHVPKPFTLRIRSTSSVAARSVLLIACHQG